MSTPSVNSANTSTVKYTRGPQLPGDKSTEIREMHEAKQKSIALSQDQKERELSLKKYELGLYKRDIDLREKELKFKMLQWEQKKHG